MKKKLLYRIISLILSLSLALNPLLASVAIAEELVEPLSDTIITGDAQAKTEVDTEINTNQTEVPGEISPGDCGLAIELCDTGGSVNVENTNQAESEATSAAQAVTGVNSQEGADLGLIDTGNASASAELNQQVNFNQTEFTNDGSDPESSQSAGLNLLIIDNLNEASVSGKVDTLAQTGANQSNNYGQATTTTTGNASASANTVNIINTNATGSNYKVLYIDIDATSEEDLDFNRLWCDLNADPDSQPVIYDQNANPIGQINIFSSENQNSAQLINQIEVTANAGQNQANNNGAATINTGDAAAQANLLNLVNTNLTGSNFIFVIINIVGNLVADVIFPSADTIALKEGNGSGTSFTQVNNQNQAQVSSDVSALANTGHNQTNNTSGDSTIITGNSQSKVSILDWINLNIFGNYWSSIRVNNFGDWQGKIKGFSSPDAVEQPLPGLNEFDFDFYPTNNQSQNSSQTQPDLNLISANNQNGAQVINQVKVVANTGENQADNNQTSNIKTGAAKALANVVNFVNTNIFGHSWLFSFINVFGRWAGDLVFAYPDLAVSLTNGTGQAQPGEILHYQLNFANQGHETAHDVKLKLDLPLGINLVNGSSASWHLDQLAPGEQGSFTIWVQVDPDFSFAEPISWLNRIIRPAYAAENEAEVTAVASIQAAAPESDLNNNQASVVTLVYTDLAAEVDRGQTNNESKPDLRQPELVITAQNNVNQFVYPGDIVTFEITVMNQGSGPAYDTYLAQDLVNSLLGENFGAAGFDLGDLEPNEGVKVSFGLQLADNDSLPAGAYYTIAQAYAYAVDNTETASNQAGTDLEIRWRGISEFFEAKAAVKEEDEGDILGASESQCQPTADVLPYVLSFLVSSLWLVERIRKRFRS